MIRLIWVGFAADWRWGGEWLGGATCWPDQSQHWQAQYYGGLFLGPLTIDFWMRRA